MERVLWRCQGASGYGRIIGESGERCCKRGRESSKYSRCHLTDAFIRGRWLLQVSRGCERLQNGRRMYECTVYRDHVTCNCPTYKFNMLCKHSLCVAENSQLLKLYIEYFKKSPRRSRPFDSGLVGPVKVAPGKKGGGANRNAWRGSRGKTNPPCSKTKIAVYPITEIYHNDRPLTLCFLSEEPKVKDCRHCRTEFPRHTMILPFDLVSVSPFVSSCRLYRHDKIFVIAG